MDKAQMIQAILGEAKSASIVAGKYFDYADLFITLAFRTERQLKQMCKKLNIAV